MWSRALRAALFVVGLAPLLTVAAADGATVDFDSLPAGTFLTGQIRESHGVSFPNGLILASNPGARSLPNRAIPPLDGEFQRQEIVAVFEVDQTEVSIAFQASEEPGHAFAVTLRAYDASDVLVESRTDTFVTNTTWRTLTVGIPSGPADIRRIVLTGGQTDTYPPTNFLFVDDLTYTAAPPPPPPDVYAPYVVFWQPTYQGTYTTRFIPVEVQVQEERHLQSVNGSITHVDSGQVVGSMDYCGSPESGACPARELRELIEVTLGPVMEGDHEVAVTACDSAGNCETRRRPFAVNLPAEVFADRVEINQGVQPRLFGIGRPGDDATAFSSVRLLSGRDTAVRFYPLARGDYRPGYSARVRVYVTYPDGSTIERYSLPNAGVPSVEVAPDPEVPEARENVFLLMRADRDRTLNYVIPGSVLAGAASFAVRLEEGDAPLTGWLRVNLQPAVRLAVKHVRLTGGGIPMGTAATQEQIDNAFRYVEEAYPISQLVVVRSGSASVPNDDVCEVSTSDLVCTVRLFSYYEPPGDVPASTMPTHVMKVGRVPYGSFRNVGIALWGSALAMVYGDSAYAHEIAHTAGRPHAGNFHDEEGGEDWPYFHGQVGPTDFGVVTDLLTPPSLAGLGQWDLTIVDPCPGASVSGRIPRCALPDDEATHDFMSYGPGAADLGPLNLTAPGRRWISSHTWNRLYEALRDKPVVSAQPSGGVQAQSSASPGSQEALLIDGMVRGDGPLQAFPILRLSARPEQLQDPPPGPYTLELYGQGNQLLLARSFDLGEAHDAEPQRAFFVGQVVPYQPDLQRVVVKKDGTRLLERSASAHAPTVRVLYPNGGEALVSGLHTIQWTVDDADGDRVISRIEYSSDGGETWGTLGMTASGEPTQLEIDIAELPVSANARFRVSASDGFRTAVDASDCPLAVGAAEPVECGPRALTVAVDFKPGSADNCINPGSGGSVPAAILGTADFDAATVDAASLVLAGLDVRLRRNGSLQCALEDVSGASSGMPDGFGDLVCHFEVEAGAWHADDGRAALVGRLMDGTPIAGWDSVCVVQ